MSFLEISLAVAFLEALERASGSPTTSVTAQSDLFETVALEAASGSLTTSVTGRSDSSETAMTGAVVVSLVRSGVGEISAGTEL